VRRQVAFLPGANEALRPRTVALAVALGAACVVVTTALSMAGEPSLSNVILRASPFVLVAAVFLMSILRGRNAARLIAAGFCLWWGLLGARVACGNLGVTGLSPAIVTGLGIGYLTVALLLVVPPSSGWFGRADHAPRAIRAARGSRRRRAA
jgi:hypothetical protein